MRHPAIGLILTALLVGGGVARAATPQVSVTTGQSMQQKTGDYGRREVDELTQELATTVGKALTRSHGSVPVSLQLVLEDATPNRPTAHELGENASLSPQSIGLGGAWIDGSATFADGRTAPFSYSFYENDLRNEFGPSIWSDAERAFDQLAHQLAKGDLPQETAPSISAHANFGSGRR